MPLPAFMRLLTVLGFGLISSVALALDEAELKAAYLYNFAKFVQWPDEERATLRFCGMGDEALRKAMASLIGKPVRSMQIGVRQITSTQDIPQCDLVYVTAQGLERARLAVNGYPILIVTEHAANLPRGAAIALIPSDNRFIFEVDLSAARQLGLQVSAKLLQLARKVY